MKRRWLLTALGAILAGAGLHFLWQALPNPLFALISPVNESVWEHLKLLYWPMLAAALVLARGPRRIARLGRLFPGHRAAAGLPAGALLRPARARRAGACRRPDAVCPDHGGRLPACRAAQPQRACAQADRAFRCWPSCSTARRSSCSRSRPRRSGSSSPEGRAAKKSLRSEMGRSDF